jgi:ketosteroid isomerase-like protein
MRSDRGAGARAADEDFFRLLASADAAGLDNLLTDDFILIDVFRGAEISRSALLALIESRQLAFAPVTPTDVTVRLHGNTAIVTGRTDMRGSFEDTPFSAASRYTHVYVHRSDGWNLAAAQGTMILEDTALSLHSFLLRSSRQRRSRRTTPRSLTQPGPWWHASSRARPITSGSN